MPDDVRTVPVTIEVSTAAAAALDDPATRARIGHLVSRTLHQENVERLFKAIEALKADAHQRGLTDEIIDEELAAYKAEHRQRPPAA